MTITAQDLVELNHLNDGGSYCIDGRKERRLHRLGLIKPNPGIFGYGYVITDLGINAIKESGDDHG